MADTVQPLARGKDPIRGRVVEAVVIPARGYGAFELAKGQIIRLVDVEGQQVPDVLVYNRPNLKEQLSLRYSLEINGKSELSTDDTLYSLDCNPLVTIVADTVGKHWWGGAFCSEPLFFLRTGKRGIPGCRENFARALAPYGLTRDDIRDGGCLNFFMSFRHGGEDKLDGTAAVEPALSKAGDYVELQAERDVLVAVSACPSDSSAVNAYNPTPIGVVVYEPEA